jgi:hypothetical protein
MQLAQFNIARALAPLDSPQLGGFMNRLDEINALAEQSQGFIWRYQTEDGHSTSVRPYQGDNMMLINLSTWESIEALYQYTYYTAHAEVFRQRKQWFEVLDKPHLVIWWVAEGYRPSLVECMDKLEHLQQHGPSLEAFHLKARFEPPA